MSRAALSLLLFCTIAQSHAQLPTDHEVFKTLKTKDSLIFHIGFVSCELEGYADLLSQDFEFYHDQSGITESYEAFIETTKNGLCSGNVNTRRELESSSLQVYPLYDQGVMYGALQTGLHRFYQKHGDQETLGSTALFTHLWIMEDQKWRLKRVISYHHQ